MASSGKKGKKTKGKTVALNEFLANKADEPEPVKPWKLSWADEDVDDDFSHRSKDKHVVLPTAPRATREPGVIDESRIPNEAPFIAYISNLPYDVDNDDIADFFKGLEIKGMRLPRDEGRDGTKLKGFGYVEFEDRESLKGALHFANRDIKGRSVGVEVADGGDDRYRRGGMGRDLRRGGIGRDLDGPDRTLGDWRSGPREEEREVERERGGFGFRDRGGGSRRDFGGGFRERDGGGFREREGGGFRERDGGGFRERESSGGFSERWGGDRDFVRREGADSSRREGFSRRGFDEREEGGAAADKDAGRTRPKLQLAPRTKAPEEKKPEVTHIVAQSSIFGGAKPVDTAAREREIEERLARERGSSDTPASRDLEARPKGDDWEDDSKSSKDNVWSRRSQKPLDDLHQEGEQSELNKEKGGSEQEYEHTTTADEPLSGQGSSVKSVGEKLEAPSKMRVQPTAVGRDALQMPELVDKGPPNIVVMNKFASLPDEEAAETSE